MRGIGVALAVAALVAGCGGGETSSDPAAPPAVTTSAPPAPTAATSTPATTTEPTTVPAATADESTTTAPSTTATDEPPADRVLLRPDGVAEVDFGTPADAAIAELSTVLGAPDRVERIQPVFDDCVEGSSWLDCVHALRVIDEGRVAVWDETSLEVALVDTDQDGARAALQFGDWQATVAPAGIRLTTPEGVHPGMTVGAVKQAVPGVEFTSNEGALDSFSIVAPDGAGFWGRLDWSPATDDIDPVDVGAVQAALNEQGADLVVDGIWGPRSEAAWLAFLAEHDIEPLTDQLWLTPEVGAALGLPPDEVTVATIEPRPAR